MRNAITLLALAGVVGLVPVLGGCGSGGTSEPAAQGVTVGVSPPRADVAPNGSVSFSAVVAGSANTAVTWTVTEAGGGSVNDTGLYTAPGTAGTFHVVAKSVADPTVSGSALVNVSAPGGGGGGGGGGTYALPADRVTQWAPGVPGGIPTYTTVYVNIAAATGDRKATIQSALDAAGKAAAADGAGRVVLLGPGVFNVSGALYPPSLVVLRGAGVDSAGKMLTQVYYTGTDDNVINFGQQWPWSYEGASINLTADAVKGASSVTVASTTGLKVGGFVIVDQVTDDPAGPPYNQGTIAIWNLARHPNDGSGTRAWYCRENRPISQVMEIAAISGNTVTFTRPFHITFQTRFLAQVTPYTVAPVNLAGVEDLRVSHAMGTKANIRFAIATRSWAKHVEVDNSTGSAVQFYAAHRCEVRDSYVHDTAYLEPGGNGYGFDILASSSDNLIENNISIRFNKVINGRSSGGGNVIAYNYMDDGGMNSNGGWVETGLQMSHYPAPHYELFEGNYSFNADGEFTEGNAVYITFFRNHLSGKRLGSVSGFNDGGNVRCAGAMTNHHWYNFVGNVLGLAGTSYTSWIQDDFGPWSAGDKAIWRIGTWDQNYSLNDTSVYATMIRDGNFDYKSNSVIWDGLGGAKSTPATLPDSLYLTGTPAFFGSNTWPWVDPLGTTKTFTLPAKARYDAGRPNG